MSLITGEFTPWKSDQNSSNKQRMAGDYMSDFINANANDKKDEQKDFTYQGSNGKNYGTNTEKMLFGNSPTSSKPSASVTVTEDAKSVKTPNTSGGLPAGLEQDEAYQRNLKTIANYNGKNGATSMASGAQYNADLMSGLNYDRAVRNNEIIKSGYETRASIKAGNDHGTNDRKAPKSKDYYSYLDTYDGPKSYDEVTRLYNAKKAQMGEGAAAAENMKLGAEKKRPYDIWSQWEKDKKNYEAAWG